MRRLQLAFIAAVVASALAVIATPAPAGPCTVPPLGAGDGWCSD